MPNKKSVFNAEAINLEKVFLLSGEDTSFRIPEYQRSYDWKKNNIQRLIEDILAGLSWHSYYSNSLTFLGTIITSEDQEKEEHFEGNSLVIIDGQQRLTTICLLATIIYDYLSTSNINGFYQENPEFVYKWFEKESKRVQERLLNIIQGASKIGDGYFRYPKIVRKQKDFRGDEFQNSEYYSGIATYLQNFIELRSLKVEPVTKMQSPPNNNDSFAQNLKVLKDTVYGIYKNDRRFITEEIFDKNLNSNALGYRGVRKLFDELPEKDSEEHKIFEYFKNKGENYVGDLRILALASYIVKEVVITTVNVTDEEYAFDIFDALNTTGEPLTAIQTFIPKLTKFENKEAKGYKGSPTEAKMNVVENYLDKFKSSTNDKQQRRAKELIVSFALYCKGKKVSLKLDEQRRFLRHNLDSIENPSSKRSFVEKLADVTKYRDKFWDPENIRGQLVSVGDRETCLICLRFLYDLNTSLSIPILCRFFKEYEVKQDHKIFADAIKSLTAFVVLRRAVTGNTGGIDSTFRSIMSRGRRRKDFETTPLCTGLKDDNQLVSIGTFKSYLIEWLEEKDITNSKGDWVEKVKDQPLGSYSNALCRFILLAASHNSLNDENEQWKLKKGNYSLENEYLTFNRWCDSNFSSLEHIAPVNPKNPTDWDGNIYSQPFTKDTIGNLTLLPEFENTLVSNDSWHHKKLIFKAYSASSTKEVDQIAGEAKKQGLNFSNQKLKSLKKNNQLPHLRTITKIENFNKKTIEERSVNLLENAWDVLKPWLFD